MRRLSILLALLGTISVTPAHADTSISPYPGVEDYTRMARQVIQGELDTLEEAGGWLFCATALCNTLRGPAPEVMRYAKGTDRAWVLACLLGIEKDLQPDGWPDEPTVEHIAPKNLGSAPAWKHLSGTDFANRQFALGNLTVLSQQDNMDAARVSFEDKCKVFERLMLRINRELATGGGWGSAEIDAYTGDRCNHALKGWKKR